MPITCPECTSSDLDGAPSEDGRIRTVCEACGHEWLRGEPKRVPKTVQTIEDLHRQFPGPDDVRQPVVERVAALKAQFLAVQPSPQPEVALFWRKYQQVFGPEGLAAVVPQDLKDFANSNVGANPGNMSIFNIAWNEMGPQQGAARTTAVIEHLLHGPEAVSLEDRLTHLVEDQHGTGMPGFKEALLTKVLCVAQPDRFLPILKYTGSAGKKEIARAVFDVRLPEPAATRWTTGRLVLWSNDLLVELVGDGFADMQHASSFLWWAKDQVTPVTHPGVR